MDHQYASSQEHSHPSVESSPTSEGSGLDEQDGFGNAHLAAQAGASAPCDPESFYSEYVVPRAAMGLAANPVDLDDPDPSSAAVVLRPMRSLRQASDVAALLAACGAEVAPPERVAQFTADLDEDQEHQLFRLIAQTLADELSFDSTVLAARMLDVEAYHDPDHPHHQAVLAVLDRNHDGAVDGADAAALLAEDSGLLALAAAVVQHGYETDAANDRLPEESDSFGAASAWANAAYNGGATLYDGLRINWTPTNRPGLLDRLRSDAGRNVEVFVAAVFRRNEAALAGQVVDTSRAATGSGDPWSELQAGFARRISEEVGGFAGATKDLDEDSHQTLHAAMGDAPLTVEIAESASLGAEFWERARAVEEGSDLARPFATDRLRMSSGDLGDGGLEQIARFAYVVTIDLGVAKPEITHRVLQAVQARPGAVAQVLIRGVAMTPTEFVLLHEHFAGGQQAGFSRDQRSGLPYDSSSPEGRRQRAGDLGRFEQSQDVHFLEGVDMANPLPEEGIDSAVGQMGAAHLLEALEVARGAEEPGMALAQERAAHNEDLRPLESDNPALEGKTLREATEMLFADIDRLTELCNTAADSVDVRDLAMEVANLGKWEIRRDNVEHIAEELDWTRQALESRTGTVIVPVGLTAAGQQRYAMQHLGVVGDLGSSFANVAGAIVDTLVPDQGDKGKLQLAVNVPIGTVGGADASLGVEFVGEAERDDKGVKLRTELAVRLSANADLKIVKAFGEIRGFLFLEAYGDSGAAAFGLALFALRDRIHAIDEEVEQSLFEGTYLEATPELDDDDYVESGGGLSAGIGLSSAATSDDQADVGLGASVKWSTGTRLEGDGDGGVRHRDVESLAVASSLSLGSVGLEGKLVAKKTDGAVSKIEVEYAGAHELDMTDFDSLTALLGRIATGAVDAAGTVLRENRSRLPSSAGALRDLGTIGGMAASCGGDLAAGFVAQYPAEHFEAFKGVKLGHKLTAKLTWKPGSGWEIEIALERTSTIQLGDNPRSTVFALLEDVDPIYTFKRP